MPDSLSTRAPLERIHRIHAESQLRDGGFVMPKRHCHPYYELYYVEQGACRFLVGDEMFDLRAGEFILIPPQVLHYTRYLFGVCRRTAVFFRMEDVGERTCSLLPDAASFFQKMRVVRVPEGYREQINALFHRMLTEERIGDRYSAAILEAQLRELLLLCGRECGFPEEAPAEIHTTDRHVLLAARFMSEQYMNPITTADIASAAGFSPNYLSRKFKETAGIGLHEYLVFLRLQHAAMELVSTTDSITEIALRCGFTSSNYFKDVFREAYGLTPRAYRKAK